MHWCSRVACILTLRALVSSLLFANCNHLTARKWTCPNGEVSLRSIVLNVCKHEFDKARTQIATSPRALGFTFLFAELYMNLFLSDGKQIPGIGEYLLELLQSLADAITVLITTNCRCDASSLDALL